MRHDLRLPGIARLSIAEENNRMALAIEPLTHPQFISVAEQILDGAPGAHNSTVDTALSEATDTIARIGKPGEQPNDHATLDGALRTLAAELRIPPGHLPACAFNDEAGASGGKGVPAAFLAKVPAVPASLSIPIGGLGPTTRFMDLGPGKPRSL